MLNRKDIKKYSSKFKIYKNEDSIVSVDDGDKLKRFEKLVKEKRYHEAIDLSYDFYFKYQNNESFITALSESLAGIGVTSEAILELFNLPREQFEDCLKNGCLSDDRKQCLIKLYDKNNESKKKRYILILKEIGMPAVRTYGIFTLLMPLVHMGNTVTIVYDPEETSGAHYLKKKYLFNARGIYMGCTHYDKKKVIEEGILNFYNQMPEEDIVVISRDYRFFEINRKECTKKITFITTDLSNKQDTEIGSLCKRGEGLIREQELSDLVITWDKHKHDKDSKYIYIESCDAPEVSVYEREWGYGYNQRMDAKSINIIYSLLERL